MTMVAKDVPAAGALADLYAHEVPVEFPLTEVPQLPAPRSPSKCPKPATLHSGVTYTALEESLELWMSRHEDTLKKLVERLEAASLGPEDSACRRSVARKCISVIGSPRRRQHLDDDADEGKEAVSRNSVARKRISVIESPGRRQHPDDDADEDGVSGIEDGGAVQAEQFAKKTLRSHSDLFTTQQDERRIKLEQIRAQERIIGTRFRNSAFSCEFRDSIRDMFDPRRGVVRGMVKEKLQALVASTAFQLFAATVILANGVAIGVDVEHQAKHSSSLTELVYLMIAMNVWYVFEVILRIAAFGKDFFVSEEDKAWNYFDLALACLSIAELIAPNSGSKGSSILRVVRIARLFRCLRLVRWLRHVREFRKMVFSMLISVQTLVWATVLLLFLLYFFGILFTSACSRYLHDHPDENNGDLDKYFGSLAASMFSLWLSISGGENWNLIVTPLFRVDRLFVGIFVAFIATMVLGVTNIVTAVFVESAMRSTQHYRDLMLQEKALMKETLAKHLRQIFHQMDVDGSGMLSLKEMRTFLADETLALQRYFEALEVNASDAKALFKLLDRDDSGEIDIDEFCDGCMRLKGEARSFDINCLLYKTQRVESRISEIGKGLDTVIGMCGDVLLNIRPGSRPTSPRQFSCDGFAIQPP